MTKPRNIAWLAAAAMLSLSSVPVPACAQAPAAAPRPPASHHTRHRHRHSAAAAGHLAALPPQPLPPPSHAGTDPAPVPNEDIAPPTHAVPSGGEYSAGSMSIHYPPTGEGFLPGSSSADMDNRTTPSVPGVQYQAPLANPGPPPLPPPGTAAAPPN